MCASSGGMSPALARGLAIGVEQDTPLLLLNEDTLGEGVPREIVEVAREGREELESELCDVGDGEHSAGSGEGTVYFHLKMYWYH